MSVITASASPIALAPMPTIVSVDAASVTAAPALPVTPVETVPQTAVPMVATQDVVSAPVAMAVPEVATVASQSTTVTVPQTEPQAIAAPALTEMASVEFTLAMDQQHLMEQTTIVRPLVDAYVNQLVGGITAGLNQPGMTVPSINGWLDTSAGGWFTAEQVANIKQSYVGSYQWAETTAARKLGREPSNISGDPLMDTTPLALQMMIRTIARVIRSNIDDGTTTSPWAILRRMQTIPQVQQMFGIPQGTTTLPVKVVSGPNSYHHQLTEDQVLGILLYPGEQRIQLSLNEQPVTRDFLANLPNSYQEGYVLLSVGEQNYLGHDASILSGYITGAEWAGKTAAEVTAGLKISVVKEGQLLPVKMQ